jgi:hypothetical protein
VTDDQNLKKVENQLTLAASLSQIREIEREKEAGKKTIEESKLRALASRALEKFLAKKGELGRLYKPELCALLFQHYGKFYFDKKSKKETLVKELKADILSNKEALGKGSDVDLLSKLNDGGGDPPTEEVAAAAAN